MCRVLLASTATLLLCYSASALPQQMLGSSLSDVSVGKVWALQYRDYSTEVCFLLPWQWVKIEDIKYSSSDKTASATIVIKATGDSSMCISNHVAPVIAACPPRRRAQRHPLWFVLEHSWRDHAVAEGKHRQRLDYPRKGGIHPSLTCTTQTLNPRQ